MIGLCIAEAQLCHNYILFHMSCNQCLLENKPLLSQQFNCLEEHIARESSIQDSVQHTMLCSSTYFIGSAA